MLRTAERRASSPVDELLDRTGIVAASVPRGRRSPEDTQPIPVVPALLPIAGDGASLLPLDTRPRAVPRRRARGWVAGTGALALLALGWLGGGLFSGSFVGHTTDDVAVPADQRDLVAPAPQHPAPAAPAPTPAAPPAAPAAPVTVYVPVPDHKAPTPAKQHLASRPTTPRSGGASDRRPTSAPDDSDLRSDTKSTPAKSPAATQFDEYMSQWKPWIDLADRMSGR